MDLSVIEQSDISAVFTDELDTVALTTAELIAEGDTHGIKYVGEPRS